MTRETFIIIIKALFTGFGSFLIGDHVMGNEVTSELWELMVGIVLSGVSIIWSIQDKEYNIEKLQAFMRQIILFVGGFFVARGKITNEQLNSVLGAVLVIIPALQSYTSKKKIESIQENKIQVSRLAAIPTEAEQKRRKLKA